MGELHALVTSALGQLGGFAACAAPIVVGYALATDERRDHEAYLRRDWSQIADPGEYAAKRGDLRMLLQVAERLTYDIVASRRCRKKAPKETEPIAVAAVYFRWSWRVFAALAEGGNLGLLWWACKRSWCFGRPRLNVFWDNSDPTPFASSAAASGQLRVLRWAHAVGLLWDPAAYSAAAREGNLGVLMWALAEGLPVQATGHGMVRDVCYDAATGGHVAVILWARDAGFPCDEKIVCAVAARHGRLEALQRLRAEGFGWDWRVFSWAAGNGDLAVLEWARAHGCEWSENGDEWVSAVEYGQLSVLRWLRAEGCPHSEDTCAGAIAGRSLDCLLWAFSEGCPPVSCAVIGRDGEVIDGDDAVNDFRLSRAIHLHGCPEPEREECASRLTKLAEEVVAWQIDDWDDTGWKEDPLFDGMVVPGTAEEWDALEARLMAFKRTSPAEED